MRNYVIINGVNSLTIKGLAINILPPISKPLMRTLREEIDGRDGDLITNLGYQAYDKTLEVGLYGSYDIDEIIAFFNQEGTIVFSDENDKYYNFKILEKIDYTKLIKFRTATITLHCQPFKYPLNETPLVEEYEYVNGSGTNFTLNNTAEAIFNKIELQGNTYQEQTSGKNLYNVGELTTTTSSGITFTPYYENGQLQYINVNGTATAHVFYNLGRITLPAGSYIITGCTGGGANTYFLGVNFGLGRMSQIDGQYPFTLTEERTMNESFIRVGNGTTVNNQKIFPMIRISSITDSTYEPYTDGVSPNPNYPQPIQVVSGDNEISITGRNLINMVETNKAVNNQGAISNDNPIYLGVEDYIDVKPNTTYTIQFEHDYAVGGNIANLYVGEKKKDGTFIGRTGFSQNRTFTTGSETYSIFPYLNRSGWEWTEAGGYLELEYGSQRHEYEPFTSQSLPLNLGNLEMASIPNTDYKDLFVKDGETWYKREMVGKIIIDGTQSVNAPIGMFSLYFLYTNQWANMLYITGGWCDHFKYTQNDNISANSSASQILKDNEMCLRMGNNSRDRLYFKASQFATTSEVSSFFTNNPTKVYYAKETLTDIEITNETLIDQLEAIKNAISYKGQTNISQTNNDMSFVLDLLALKENSDHLVIDNIGNIYSKPTLDLEGTGIVDIYLNDTQMFEVDLSEKNEIVIDTEKMEAYNPTDNTLANRQVVGDYSKFKLDSGENDLRFSGNLTKATITNYERWL